MAAVTLGRFAHRTIHLGFLGPWPFRCENPVHEGWIVLDFLGFSRSNQDFSMGYAARNTETFFSALFPSVERRHNERVCLGHAEAPDCSWSKLNLVSDFLQ
jgi:hypothetical protein